MTRYRILCVLLIGWVGGSSAVAQVNTERMRALDVDGVAAEVDGDVALQSGNADVFEVGLGLRVDAQKGRDYTFLVGSVRYGEKDGDAFRNRSFAHLRYNRTLVPWLVGESFAQVEHDGFARLRLRTLGGAGLRVRYLDTDAVKIFQGTTPMYEYESLDVDAVATHPAQTSRVRWSNYLNVHFRLTEATHLRTTIYVQPRLDAFDDVRVLNEAVLGVVITERVSLNVRLDLRYDSRPPDDVEDLDLALRNGITVAL